MLVLDANILIRAVLRSKVLLLLHKYSEYTEFLSPDTSFQEAHEHLPEILTRRRIPVPPALEMLELVAGLVQTVEAETYTPYEAIAR